MSQPTLKQLSDRAERQVHAGNWVAARQDWLQALAMAPASADIMLELSYVESLAGHYRAGHDWTVRAAAAIPRTSEGMRSLVLRLRTFNEVGLLRHLVQRLLATPSSPFSVLVECARQLSNLNDFPLALACAEAAVAKAPADPSARLVRGQLLANFGQIEAATADFGWVLQRNPRMSIAWWLLARLRKQTKDANHVAQLSDLLRTPGLAAAEVAALARALHKEFDDLGDHDAAWQALELMCRARRLTEQYDAARERRLFDALLAWSPLPQSETNPSGAGTTPVLIVGMHRSGTTLLEQLLSGNPEVRGLGELNDFTSAMRQACDHYCKGALDLEIVRRASNLDFSGVGDHYLADLAWRLGDERCFVDKQPSNFLNTGFICQALPQAKILHMVRDPVETCFSNLRELFTEVNPFSYDQYAMGEHFLQYRNLMRHWHETFPGRILDVDYARLTSDTESVMREVAAFCGIDYVAAMTDTASSGRAVSTASSIQVREGVIRRERPKWAPYARHLQPLINALRKGGIEVGEPPA